MCIRDRNMVMTLSTWNDTNSNSTFWLDGCMDTDNDWYNSLNGQAQQGSNCSNDNQCNDSSKGPGRCINSLCEYAKVGSEISNCNETITKGLQCGADGSSIHTFSNIVFNN